MKDLILAIAESSDHEFRISLTFPTKFKVELIEIVATFFPVDFKKAEIKNDGDSSTVRIFTYDAKLVDKFKDFAQNAGRDGLNVGNKGFVPLLDPEQIIHSFDNNEVIDLNCKQEKLTEKKEFTYIDSTKIPNDERLFVREINAGCDNSIEALGITDVRMRALFKLCVEEFKNTKTPIEAIVNLSKKALHANELYILAVSLEKLSSITQGSLADILADTLKKLKNDKKD